MRYLRYLPLLLGIVFLTSGCGTRSSYTIVPDYQARKPTSIAVMPAQNETVDLDAPKAFRKKVAYMVSQKGYLLRPIDEVDSALKEKGLIEAGQLGFLTPEEIGDALNVDALLYTTVTEWNKKYFIFYSSISVGGRFQLIDAKTGEKLWESEHVVSDKRIALEGNTKKLNLAHVLLQKYDPYVWRVIRKAFSTLPHGSEYFRPNKKHRGLAY